MPSTKRRKSRATRKEESLRIRVTTEQKRVLVAAAERAGLELSGWLRSLALREAERTLGSPVEPREPSKS